MQEPSTQEPSTQEPGAHAAPGKRAYATAVLAPASDYALSCGIVLAANTLAIAVIDFAGRVRLDHTPRFAHITRETVLLWATSVWDQVRQAGLAKTVVGVGIGVGAGDHACGDWAGIDVATLFTRHLGVPCWAGHAGHLAAVAENMLGVGRLARDFAYLAIDTKSSPDVSGGLVLNGALWRGASGHAGAFTHGLPNHGLPDHDSPNHDFPSPDLERLRQRIVAAGHPCADVRALLEAWDDTWLETCPGIDAWIAEVRRTLSLIASNAAALLDLDAVVLGGVLPRTLATRLLPHITLPPRARTKVVLSEISGNAAAIGAALLPLQQGFFTP